MALLVEGREHELIQLASQINLDVNVNTRIVELKELITTSENYEKEFILSLFHIIVVERKKINV